MSDEKRPVTVEDLNRIKQVEGPQISPDGAWIAYVLVTPDPLEDRYSRNIWLVSAKGGDPIQITRSSKDMNPTWSPDGKQLAFVSSRNDKPQVYIMPVQAPGGEARQLTSMENGATNPAWSPDGSQIVFLSGMNANERAKEDNGEKPEPPADKLEGKHRKERKDEDEKIRWDPRPVWRIPYRAGTSYLDDRYQQVYVIPTAEGLKDHEAKPRRLTDIDAHYLNPQWSVDGKVIYTSRTADPMMDEPFRWYNMYRITVEDGTEERIANDDFSEVSPILSPDGKWFAFWRSMRDKTDYLSHFMLASTDGSEIRQINAALDREVTDCAWSPEGKLAFTVASDGNIEPYNYDPETGTMEKVASGIMQIEAIDIGKDGCLAFSVSTPTNPSELYRWSKETGVQQITGVNAEFLSEVIVQETHEIRYQSPGGTEIQGWYLYPVGAEEGTKPPLALNIHGGPHVMWGPSTRTMWHEWQYHAAEGYFVFYCNPRGGDGYGEAFQRALHDDWGNVAMTDIMAGVDLMVEKGFVDEDRMAISGGSYGGYMTAWIIGHTDRFKAAVPQRGVYNLLSFYGTSDVPILISNEFDGEPWEIHQHYWEHSPLAYAHNIKTPLLIIHSENDFRVPIEQGEQLFAFVRRSGDTPVRMLRYPREGHELSRSGEPKHRISRLKEMVDWFDRYCKNAE